jgi:hypothetical protein
VLFVPGMAPFEQQNWAAKSRSIKLYVRRVFISDEFDEDLMPRWVLRKKRPERVNAMTLWNQATGSGAGRAGERMGAACNRDGGVPSCPLSCRQHGALTVQHQPALPALRF